MPQSEKTSRFIQILSLIIALLALLMSFISIRSTTRHATKDFQVSEHVKEETISLISSLVSLAHKGVIYSQQDPKKRDDPRFEHYVNINDEQSVVQSFLTSPSAFAFILYTASKSEDAGDQAEDWRTFLLEMTILTTKRGQFEAAIDAMRILRKYFDFDRKSFDRVLKEVRSISNSVEYSTTVRS